jgi:uncharacterized surface protein with fasciclin (FAS1) repeats
VAATGNDGRFVLKGASIERTVIVEDARAGVEADLERTNGVIHIIDTVLMPK